MCCLSQATLKQLVKMSVRSLSRANAKPNVRLDRPNALCTRRNAWIVLLGKSDLRYTFSRIHYSAELGKMPGSYTILCQIHHAVQQGCVRPRNALKCIAMHLGGYCYMLDRFVESHVCGRRWAMGCQVIKVRRSAKLPQTTSYDASFGHVLRLEYQRYVTCTPLLFLALSLA